MALEYGKTRGDSIFKRNFRGRFSSETSLSIVCESFQAVALLRALLGLSTRENRFHLYPKEDLTTRLHILKRMGNNSSTIYSFIVSGTNSESRLCS